MPKPTQRITIVGGGLVGASLALLLARCAKTPWSITLIEAKPFPTIPTSPTATTMHKLLITTAPSAVATGFDARSTALALGTIKTLQKLGCWDMLAPYVAYIQSVQVSDQGHLGGLTLTAQEHNVDYVGAVIENYYLGQVLLSQLQASGVECLVPAQVLRCTPKANDYQVVINHDKQEQTLSTDLLIIADGAQSALRQSLGIHVSSHDYQQVAWVTNVALDQDHRGIAYERFTRNGPIALLPLPSHQKTHRAALVWTTSTTQAKALFNNHHATNERLIKELQHEFGYRAGKILCIGKGSRYPLHHHHAEEQVRSGLVILGNAAHTLHPVAGQGFNLSLRDCIALTNTLTDAADAGESISQYTVLRRYIERQALDQSLTLGITHRMVTLFSSQQLTSSILRQLGLLSLSGLPRLRQTFGQRMMGCF